ncbi:MAG: hypothetical protein J5974_06470 [Pyramidobacter sp.]|nr:hypothetical protein [Pyramidobacter sp.]
MRRSLATVEPSVLDFSNFPGGLNLRDDPENIADNELAACVNMTYSSAPGKLRTRAGIGSPLAEFETRVKGLCWYNGQLLAVTNDRKLWKVGLSVQEATTEIGTLTGGWRPYFCEYGGKLYIASHSTLQEYDGTNLTTITGAPNADVVYARAGRLFCSYNGSDTIRGSAVGDPLSWTVPSSPTDADPVEVQIGYKVAGNITAIVPALTDVIVFKEHGIFRLVGEYPDWTIKEVTRDEEVANHHCAVGVAGFVFYLDDRKGLRILQGTQGYEEIIPGEAIPKVNPWVRTHMDHDYGGIWHLPARNILVVNPNDNTGKQVLPCYYEFGFDGMPALIWDFPDVVQAIVEPDRDHLYIAVGNGVYDFSGVSAYDPSGENGVLQLVKSSFSTKSYASFSSYLVKRMTINAHAMNTEIVTDDLLNVFINTVPYLRLSFFTNESPIVYGNQALVYGNEDDLISVFRETVNFAKHNVLRQRSIQINFESSGVPFELTRLAFEMVPVGVTA